jgi:hypothetical protein
MAEKRFRDFLRVSMTARTAKVLQEYVVDRTYKDHENKCVGRVLNEPCPHATSMPGSRAVDTGLVVGKKRATLDLDCPYSFDDIEEQNAQIKMLENLAERIKRIGETRKGQVNEALVRISDEILAYAQRNPMVVIAEAALPPSRSRARSKG